MTGGAVLALLILAGTPEVPDRRPAGLESRQTDKPIAGAVDLARKWGIVTSVRRSPEHNRAVGGARNSFHLHGRAVDIARRPGVRHAEIEAAYRKAGYSLLESLDEGDHSHFAFGITGQPSRTAPAQATELAARSAPARCDAGDAALNARRRPDRAGDCVPADEPAPRLKPLDAAP